MVKLTPVVPTTSWLIRVLPNKYKPAGAAVVAHYRRTRLDVSRRVEKLRERVVRWFTLPPPTPVLPVNEFLRNEHIQLLDLQRRQFWLEAVDAEWKRIVGTKTATIWDEAVLQSLLDADAMNVIDLCSWVIGKSDAEESLLFRVKDQYLDDLPAKRPWALPREDSEDLARSTDEAYAKARERLFPGSNGRALTDADGRALILRFEKRVKPLRDDRNKNRAHRHEHKTHGTAPMLKLEDARMFYEELRQLLNDLCMVAFGSTWSETDLNSNNVSLSAEDTLDTVFLPNWFRREMRRSPMNREQIYEALRTDPRSGDFNSKEKLVKLADAERVTCLDS